MEDKKNQSLEDYLMTREIDFTEPKVDLFSDFADIQKVAQAWDSNKEGIVLVLREQIRVMERDLLYTARPEEVLVIRQALTEIVKLAQIFTKASAEVERRKKAEEGKGEEPIVDEPVVEEAVDEQSSIK